MARRYKEIEIIQNLSNEYSIKSLCEIMNVSKSGYYKWLKNKDKLNQNEINRINLSEYIISDNKILDLLIN